jgi:signal transduction histidine kinase
MKILIVDDSPIHLKLLRITLEAAGMEVILADDGIKALEILEREAVSAVVSDVLMPRMDGYRLCLEIRARPKTAVLPVLLYTATYTSPSDERLALDAGADRLIPKSCPSAVLVDTLREVIAKPRDVPSVPKISPGEVLMEYSDRLVEKLEQKNCELTQRTEELEAAVRKRDQFLAMLSHELRNPLGAVLSATYVLDRMADTSLCPASVAACRVIQRQTLQVARLLDDLLDMSRVMHDRIEVRRQVVDLTQLVDDVVNAVQPLIDARRHQMAVNVAQAPLYVCGDPARLLQIQENLLANAAKYTPPGGQIHLSLLDEDGTAVIRVRDNGSGIPHHMLESIFELFVQSDDSLDRSGGGLGIGLTLVKKLVELHGGRITAHSQGAGQGSEFVIRLPMAASPASAESRLGAIHVHTRQPHVIIVEDNDDSREMLQALLQLEGYHVSAARDGPTGLQMIVHQRPEAAIIDIGLPQLNGYELARQLRQTLGDDAIYLIALTGYGRAEDREAANKEGFHAHLVKPLKPHELGRLLANGLDARTPQTTP